MGSDGTIDGAEINRFLDHESSGHLETLWRRNQALSTLLSLNSAVSTSLDLREVVKAALDNTVKLFDATAGDIVLSGLPDETRAVWMRPANRLTGLTGVRAPRLNRELSSQAAKTGKPLVAGIRPSEDRKGRIAPGIERFAIIPLSARGQVLGVMTLGCGPASSIDEIDSAMFESVGAITGAAIENSRLYLRLKRISDTDSITGIYNHRFIMEKLGRELKRSIRYGRPLSVIMLDLDKFKSLNDRYGHLFGDLVLKKTALAITSACRQTDFVGRYGGDEFIVILPETGEEETSVVAGRARERIRSLRIRPQEKTAELVGVGASVGQAVFPVDGKTRRELIAIADRNLYISKRAGYGWQTDKQAA